MRATFTTAITLLTMTLNGCVVEEAGFELSESDVPESIAEDYDFEIRGDGDLLQRKVDFDDLPVLAQKGESEAGATLDGFTVEADVQNSCWVTLRYCVDPVWGYPTCSQVGCTLEQAYDYCNQLVCNICGCQFFGVLTPF